MLPPIDPATLPAHVRSGSAEDRDRYTAALAFERALLVQLTQKLSDSASIMGEDEERGAGASPYKDMLPSAMADGLTGAGGIGLADELYRALSGVDAPAGAGVDDKGAPAAGGEEASA
jgi:Rod binding domain-containing protein